MVTNEVVERTFENQIIYVTNTVIQVQPANPQVIYVPTYNPQVVYVEHHDDDAAIAVVSFGIGMACGAAFSHHHCDWHYGGCYYGGYPPPPPPYPHPVPPRAPAPRQAAAHPAVVPRGSAHRGHGRPAVLGLPRRPPCRPNAGSPTRAVCALRARRHPRKPAKPAGGAARELSPHNDPPLVPLLLVLHSCRRPRRAEPGRRSSRSQLVSKTNRWRATRTRSGRGPAAHNLVAATCG